MNKCAIVTGANGFVGKALVSELLQNDYTVYAVVRAGKEKTLPQHQNLIAVNCELEKISELKDKIPQGKCRAFYHLAWSGSGSGGFYRSDTKLQLKNVQWSVDALNVSKELGCERFVFAGSIMEHESVAAVYTDGNHPNVAYNYGMAKVTAHGFLMAVGSKLGIDVLFPAITNAYGVGEISARMVNTTLRKCIRGEAPQFTAGTQNYDFVYITDVARAFRLIAENGKAFHEYPIGSGNAKPLKELLLEMKAAVAPDLDFIFGDIPFTGINLPLSSFDISKTIADTGFKPQVSFTDGCRKAYEWLKTQEQE